MAKEYIRLLPNKKDSGDNMGWIAPASVLLRESGFSEEYTYHVNRGAITLKRNLSFDIKNDYRTKDKFQLILGSGYYSSKELVKIIGNCFDNNYCEISDLTFNETNYYLKRLTEKLEAYFGKNN